MVIGKGQRGWEFVKPLVSHCLIHMAFSAVIILFFLGVRLLWFLPIEFAIHFIVDRLKSGPRYGGQFSMTKAPRAFWCLFGVDQFLHQLTYVLFVFFVSVNGDL